MNLEELQTARDRERQTDKLQQLRESFYADAGEFIQQLRAERDRAADRATDPFDSPEVTRLTDEIQTAEQTVEAIYEKRVGKIVKAASFAAADLPAEADGMTTEEQELFETLVDRIKDNRQHVLAVLAGEESPTESTVSQPEAAANDGDGVAAADLMGAGADDASDPTPPPMRDEQDPTTEESETHTPPPESPPDGESKPAVIEEPPTETGEQPIPPEAEPDTDSGDSSATGDESTGESAEDPLRNDGGQRAETATAERSPKSGPDGPESPGIERRRIQVTADIDPFVGSDDREYDLAEGDVVTLPEPNATLLLERDVAEQL